MPQSEPVSRRGLVARLAAAGAAGFTAFRAGDALAAGADVPRVAYHLSDKDKVQFVLGDLLPGDLVDEYRVQLQKFLQDPSDASIDAVTQAIEAKAKTFD